MRTTEAKAAGSTSAHTGIHTPHRRLWKRGLPGALGKQLDYPVCFGIEEVRSRGKDFCSSLSQPSAELERLGPTHDSASLSA